MASYFLLSSSESGFAVSNPSPANDLRQDIRQKGHSVGDVVILLPDKSLDLVGNLACPEGDPANPNGVPPNFECFEIDTIRTREHRHPPETIISRDTRRKANWNFNADLTNSVYVHSPSYIDEGTYVNGRRIPIAKFSTSYGRTSEKSKSAALYLPDGASTWDLRNDGALLTYLKTHGPSWYEFVKNVLGRNVRPEDLIFVTGVTKGSSWCIATADNFLSASEWSVKLKAAQVGGVGASHSSEWEDATSSMCWGPHRGPGEEPSGENQTLFVRGFQLLPSRIPLRGPTIRRFPAFNRNGGEALSTV
ncbi:hypothetical protein GGX14DRAFT_576721 [Mycena pura]|uniref:Uncharacterized protein n=1 Tax=Mycena pura TaxID=153505 RepID=A0AAD6UXC0_9AGAR|nr:hypothetical protein GGX14DRAFT_576721 [Mycena pura]